MKVNVVITCYNKELWVRRAIDSVMTQTLKDFDCVVVDDGSTDGSLDEIRNAIKDDERFMLIKLKNSGVANARNYGINLGSAPYVCSLDADDAIKEDFLQVLYDDLEQNKTIGVGYTAITGITFDDKIIELDWGDPDHDAQFEGVNQVPCCNLFRRSAWSRTGGYNQRYAPLGAGAEDADFWLKIFEIGYTAKQVTKEPLFVYSLATGLTTTDANYKEVDWFAWHKNKRSFASVNGSELHEVKEYDQPKFAIIIPVGPGHEHLVFDALDSIENQTRYDWEVCVVWDTEKDDFYYKRLIDGYPYVKIAFNNSGKHGAGTSRNIGARATNAKYLVFLDADDYLQPRFLEHTSNTMQASGAAWVYTDLWSQTFVEAPVKDTINIKTKLGYESIKKTELKDFDAHNQFYGGTAAVTALYRRSDYEAVGGFDELYNREDWDFHMRLAINGKCGIRLPVPLFTYRLHAGFRREYKDRAVDTEESSRLKKQDVMRIQGKYPLENLTMACTTCKKKIEQVGENEMVTMDYVANPAFTQEGAIFNGKATGRQYPLDRGLKIHNVHPQDAAIFESLRLFRTTPGQAAIPTEQPVTAVTQQPVTAVTQQQVQELPREDQIARTNKWMEEQQQRARAEVESQFETLPVNPVQEKPKQTVADLSLAKIKAIHARESIRPDIARNMLDQEKAGKNRSTVVAWLEKKLD